MREDQSQSEGLFDRSEAETLAGAGGRSASSEPSITSSEQRWAVAARHAIARVDAAGFGQRGTILKEEADEFDIGAAYLKRGINALRFSESGVVKGVELSEFPIVIVEELRRWCAFDVAKATRAAKRFEEDELSFDGFFEEAAAARAEAEIAPQPGFRTATELRSVVRDAARAAFSGYELVKRTTGLAQSSIALKTAKGSKRVAVVVTGPYAEETLELSKCREALVQALGLMMINEQVVLACASDRAAGYARDMLKAVKPAKGLTFRDAPLKDRIEIWSFDPSRAKGLGPDGRAFKTPVETAGAGAAKADMATGVQETWRQAVALSGGGLTQPKRLKTPRSERSRSKTPRPRAPEAPDAQRKKKAG